MNSDKCLPIIKKQWRKQFTPICYGILQPDGTLYMSESCICEDEQPLRDEVLECAPEGSRIVRLYVKRLEGKAA